MNNFTVHEFELPNNEPTGQPGPWKLSSIVMTEEEFDSLLEFISTLNLFNAAQNSRMNEEQVKSLKKAKHIPMIRRGTKTRAIFERYGCETDYLSVIVRGHGVHLAEQFFGSSGKKDLN